MENEIISKMKEIKDILLNKIKTFDDYNINKDKIIVTIEEIEKMFFEIFKENKDKNYLEDNINKNNEFEKNTQKKDNQNLNENKIKNEENGNNEKEKELGNLISDKDEINNKKELYINEINEIANDYKSNNGQVDEEEEKYSLPKLNFDYDKNINEILNDINLEENKPFTSIDNNNKISNFNIKEDLIKNNSINNDIIKNISKKKEEYKKNEEQPINHLIKNIKEGNYTIKDINNFSNDIKISNLQRNGYSDLFSFNHDLSNSNTKSFIGDDEFSSNKNKNLNLNNKEEEFLNPNNNVNKNNNDENINNKSLNNERNISNFKNDKKLDSVSSPENENENIFIKLRTLKYLKNKRIKNSSKALRVADIIMKINTNDILYDIIIQLYTKDILNQLMSPNVDMNLITSIEETIEKITILENEEIQKLRDKESSLLDNNKNIINNCDELKNTKNIKSINNQKCKEELNNHRISCSLYDKNNSSCYSQMPSKIPLRRQINKYNAEYLNSEILQNYPKTGKTILGYEKFKKDKNKEFNFERSLRNDNYMDGYKNKRNNNSKSDSAGKNQSYYSNNRNLKKKFFNNFTTPFGDYFDSSLQKGGQSKLKMNYPNPNDNKLFKNCRSPVKDYIDGINDVFI